MLNIVALTGHINNKNGKMTKKKNKYRPRIRNIYRQ